MYLKSLELSGFKSFAKKTILEFQTPITSIVGPNGSGKSNVAEAFRFVLGEQSIKSLRGKRGEDLIFNGSTKIPRQNRASIKVVFDNTKRLLNIDFDQVSFERVVHRDGINEYFINGTSVRLKDIIELLAGAHIGSSGHHIISQGEADRILNANLKERRLMVEDALGLKVYQYKRQESERKLEKTRENIQSVESLRKEIAPHIKFLRKQVEKIEKSRALKDELVRLYQDYFKREETYIKHERLRLDVAKKAPLETLHRIQHAIKVAKEVLSNAEGSDTESFRVIEIENEMTKTRREKDTLARELGRVEGELRSEARRLEKLKELKEADLAKTISLKEVEELAREFEEKIFLSEKENDIGVIRGLLVHIREAFRSFISRNKISGGDSVSSEITRTIATLHKEKKEVEEKMHKAEILEIELQKKYTILRDDIEKEKDRNRDAEKEVFRLKAEENEINVVLETLRNEEERLKISEEDFKRELHEGAVLAGRQALDYDNLQLLDVGGKEVTVQMIISESRTIQSERKRTLEKIKIRLEELGGGSGDEIMKEFKDAEERDQFLLREIEDLEKSTESLGTLIAELTMRLDTEFRDGVQKINTQFQNFFALMFGGGLASLSVLREKKRKKRSDTDFAIDDDSALQTMEEEEGEEGIDINVTLPNKRTKGLEMLSGGERALTSIALLFAISQVNPPPFIILDETDAALDEANSRKYGDMIESLAKHSQLILISHNRETMSRAGVLFGVTMGSDGASRLLSIAFEEAVQVAK